MSPPKALTVLTLVLMASAPACRPCDRVENEFNERMRDELAMVGAGTVVDTGVADHIRFTFSGPAFEFAAAPLGRVEVFRPAARQTTVPRIGATDLTLEGDIVTRLINIRATSASDGRVIEITLDSVLAFELDAIDMRSSSFATTARTVVRAPLSFLPIDGGAVLAIDMSDAVVSDLGLEAAELSGELPMDLTFELTTALLDDVLSNAPELLSVLEIPRLELGWSSLEVAPSSLVIHGESGAVTVGIVTPLRPTGAMSLAPAPIPLGFAVDVHPDLWRSALAHLQAVGRMPRRFHEDGEPSITGEVGVAVDRASASGDRIELRTTSWCFGNSGCRVERHVADGRFGPSDGRVSVSLAGTASAPADWETAMLAAARETASALLNPAPIRLEAASELRLVVDEATATGARTRLTGSVELREAQVF